MFEKINQWFLQGLWNDAQVNKAAEKGVITFEQAEQILKGVNS